MSGATLRHTAAGLFALGLFSICGSATAQTLIAAETVCGGESMRVDWTGPNGPGDAITLARVDDSPTAYDDIAYAADGEPARLNSPLRAGRFEVRYVQGATGQILARRELAVTECEALPRVAVTFQGMMKHHNDEIDTSESTAYGPAGMSVEDFCVAMPIYGDTLNNMIHHIEMEMYSAGVPISIDTLSLISDVPSRASVEQAARNAYDDICNSPEPDAVAQAFTITYAYCRMSMRTPTHVMDIHIPPGMGGGMMSAADHIRRDGAEVHLRSNVEKVSAIVGKGWNHGLDMSPPIETGERIGFPTEKRTFRYEMGLGGEDNPMALMGRTIEVRNEGTVWVSREVPGMDIVELFYERLTTEMSPDGGGMSFFGGMISNLVGMLQYGIPMEMDQTTSSSAIGGGVSVRGRSEHFVTGVELHDFDEEWCQMSLIPAEYDITDVDAELANALGDQDPEELAQAMAEYERAMEQMTPEQRAMMEQMGMGDMMKQAMGGNMSGGSMAGGATGMSATGMSASGASGTATASAAAGFTATQAAGSACTKSSKELTTNNMTQSVQMHLQALGYDTGNTDGVEALNTTIAVSQFQAEKGVEVTGEISPQLLGLLAAQVDSGC